MKSLHIIISGKVQGVFFRQRTKELALKLGLKGYVKNLPNGYVEVVAQGDGENLSKLVEFCKRGPDLAEVKEIKVNYTHPKENFESFDIRH